MTRSDGQDREQHDATAWQHLRQLMPLALRGNRQLRGSPPVTDVSQRPEPTRPTTILSPFPQVPPRSGWLGSNFRGVPPSRDVVQSSPPLSKPTDRPSPEKNTSLPAHRALDRLGIEAVEIAPKETVAGRENHSPASRRHRKVDTRLSE